MFIARAFQSHRDRVPFAVEIFQRHTQNAMPARDRAPVADSLAGSAEQCQNRLVSPGRRGVDQFLNLNGFKAPRKCVGCPPAESITLLFTRRQIASNHAVARFLREWVA